MISVSDNFAALASANGRLIDFKITTNDEESTVYGSAVIISAKISRAITENGLQIGNCISDRLDIVINTTDKVKSNTLLKPYVRFKGDENSEWLQLGRFYAIESHVEDKLLYVTAYDRFYSLDKKIKWTGKGDLSALLFPATMQEVLNYICAYRGITTDFVCQPFSIATQPAADYTQRDLIGYIASAHGGNAKFSNTGVLQIKQFSNQSTEINVDKCFSQTIDSSDYFTVKGVLFTVDDSTQIYIDDTENSEYDEEMEGCIECYNPFASIAIAEYVWSKLGNLTYYDCEITRRGIGCVEVGDVLQMKNHNEPTLAAVNIVANEIEYEISCNGGFTEKIASIAETAAQSSNRTVKKNEDSAAINVTDSIILTQNQGKYYGKGEYVTIKVIDGEQIVYGSSMSDIICNGYVCHKSLSSYVGVDYQSVNLLGITYSNEFYYFQVGNGVYYFRVRIIDTTNNSDTYSSSKATFSPELASLVIQYNSIYSPTTDYPNGYAVCSVYLRIMTATINPQWSNAIILLNNAKIPFQNCNEYNAAMQLTTVKTGGVSALNTGV